MRVLRPGICLASLALLPAISLAQRAVEMNATGYAPKSPPGLAQPLGSGPFNYRTGEGQQIRVTVLARLAWPYGMAFLPNGDLLITQRTGELRRMAKGTTTLQPVAGGPQAIPTITSGVHAYMSMAVHPRFAQNNFVYIVYTKPQPENKRTTAVARSRYVNGTTSGHKGHMGGGQHFWWPGRRRDDPGRQAVGRPGRRQRQDRAGPHLARRQGPAFERRRDGAAGQSLRRQGRLSPGDLYDGPSHRAGSRREPGQRGGIPERDGPQRWR